MPHDDERAAERERMLLAYERSLSDLNEGSAGRPCWPAHDFRKPILARLRPDLDDTIPY